MITPNFAEYLSVFADVVRSGSFSAAARKRAQTPSAVVRQIDALEHELGVALFIRSTRSLTLTDSGQKLYQRALRLLDELADVHAEVSAFDISVSGTLRIACLPSFGKRYVLPVIAALEAEHPALRVELDLTERLYNPVTERLDVMIRMGDLPDSTLIAMTLAPLTRLLASRSMPANWSRTVCSINCTAPTCWDGRRSPVFRTAKRNVPGCSFAAMILKPYAARHWRAWASPFCPPGLSARM
jgi:DNA-binding transcriptional LysR family regulator